MKLRILILLGMTSLWIGLQPWDLRVQTSSPITTSFDGPSTATAIEAYAQKHDIPAIDATIDRVWKAIPGYNGLAVDQKKSLKKMGTRFSEQQIVWKEVSPSVHLSELPPSPIYRGNPEKPMISLLINVAWGNEFIEPILRALDKHEAKATFFLDGSWTKKNSDLARLIQLHGHEIGSHAYSHPDLAKSSEAKTREELQKTNDVIEEVLGLTPTWFAPPSGSFNQRTIEIARELGMYTILWTVDTVDWRNPDTTEMVNRVVSKVENGTMILMHPTKPTSEGLDRMIGEIKEKGYVVGTVSELMSEERVQ
ncbi:chitooligosaccharide deacetylase [Bacillus sp. OxB-1]|uniref:polysaccharide deacetylase family protein n=1 Tax=Bacillus sp. (strain OxB-1) TaxID=98228 RepID=UPI000581CADA|nr:polysaccharide deacetylase family protein [Bacillus sp. OxB-1]BAQ11987.1 chitooligosaccharide deacetylase [Bacillus sp. OxB-1]